MPKRRHPPGEGESLRDPKRLKNASSLPTELWVHALGFLDERSRFVARAVCPGWRELIESHFPPGEYASDTLYTLYIEYDVTSEVILCAEPRVTALTSKFVLYAEPRVPKFLARCLSQGWIVPSRKLLLLAGVIGDYEAIRLLLADGRAASLANLEQLLVRVSQAGLIRIVQLILERSDVKTTEPAWSACVSTTNGFRNQAEILRVFLEDGRVDYGRKCLRICAGDWFIEWSAENGHPGLLSTLLENGRGDPAMCDDSPLARAAENGHVECVRLLLENGRANPAARGYRIVIDAARLERHDALDLLLADPRVNPEEAGQSAIDRYDDYKTASVIQARDFSNCWFYRGQTRSGQTFRRE